MNGCTQRRAEETKALIRCYEFNCHGVAMNQRYASAAVIPDGTPEPAFNRDHELYHHATTWPGAHLPHVWVEHHGVRKSTLDLAGKGRFTLLTGIGGEGWRSAAARSEPPTGSLSMLSPCCSCQEESGARRRGIGMSGCFQPNACSVGIHDRHSRKRQETS